MGILRPGLDSPKRKYFNFFHYLVGYSAQIMGFAALYLGMEIFGLEGTFEPLSSYFIQSFLLEWSKSLLISIAVIWLLVMVLTRFTKSIPILGKIIALLFFLVFIGGFAAILSQLALAR